LPILLREENAKKKKRKKMQKKIESKTHLVFPFNHQKEISIAASPINLLNYFSNETHAY
jgi:hypothetical protein